MDLHLTPGVAQLSNTHLMIPHHKQMLQPQLSLKQETLFQNLCQQIDWKHYYKCKKHISRQLSNRKAPKHEANLFIHVNRLLCKCVTDSHQEFLDLMIPKAWKYPVLAHDKLEHQRSTQTYYLPK